MNELQEQWKYEFKTWASRFGSPVIEMVEHEDRSESYEMDAAHVFKLENGNFAFVTECGCSCYSSDDADIDLFQDLEKAQEAFRKWQKKERC